MGISDAIFYFISVSYTEYNNYLKKKKKKKKKKNTHKDMYAVIYTRKYADQST